MATMMNNSLRFELVGQEALVHDSNGGVVVRLTGVEHSVIERLMNGEQITAPTESEQAAIDRLLQAGIVLDDDPTSSRFSRRRVMQLSAAGAAAAGFAYLALPSAAAASSVGDFNPGGPIPEPTGGSTPSAGNTAFSRSGNGNVGISWETGSGNAFEYRWTVFRTDGSRVATGIATSTDNTQFFTAVNFTGSGIVRVYVGGTVVDFVFGAVTPP